MKAGVLSTNLKSNARAQNEMDKIRQNQKTLISKVMHQDNIDNFFDNDGIKHKEFMQEGSTINVRYYLNVMEWLVKQIQRA